MDEAIIEKAARALAALRGSCGCDYPSCIGGECDHDCERNDKWQAVSDDDRERAEAVLRAVIPLIEAAAFERAAKVAESVDLFDGDFLKNSDARVTCATAIHSLTEKQNGA